MEKILHRQFLHNTNNKGVVILFEAMQEITYPEDHFDTEESVAFARLPGHSKWFTAVITGWNGEKEVYEVLGCCSYVSFEEFFADSYCKDMIDAVLAQFPEKQMNVNE